MPLIPDDGLQYRFEKAVETLPESKEEEKTSFSETFTANVILDNMLVSPWFTRDDAPDFFVDNPNFNPLDYITDEQRKNPLFVDSIMAADNESEIEAAWHQYQWEMDLRDQRDKGGIMPVILSEGLDLINLFPVAGTTYKTYRTGASILKGAAVTGTQLAGATAAEEAFLNYNQMARSFGESSTNTTAAFVLGSIFGGAAVKLQRLAEKANVDYQQMLKETEYAFDPEGSIKEGLNPVLSEGLAKSIGSAQAQEIVDVQIKGKAARGFLKALEPTTFTGPSTRNMLSKNKEVRIFQQKLADYPLDIELPKQSPPIVRNNDVIVLEGENFEQALKRTQEQSDKNFLKEIENYENNVSYQSVERNIKSHETKFYKGQIKLEQAWKGYAEEQNLNKGVMNVLKSGFNRAEFMQAAGKAQRNGSDNKWIQMAADSMDSELYAPMLKEAQEAGIPGSENWGNVKTAHKYLNRIWNNQAIIENMGLFQGRVKKWLIEKDQLDINAKLESEAMRTELEKYKISTERKEKQISKNLDLIKVEEKKLAKLRSIRKSQIARSFDKTDKITKLTIETEKKIGELQKALDNAKYGEKGKIKEQIKDLRKKLRESKKGVAFGVEYNKFATDKKRIKVEKRELSWSEARLRNDINASLDRISGWKAQNKNLDLELKDISRIDDILNISKMGDIKDIKINKIIDDKIADLSKVIKRADVGLFRDAGDYDQLTNEITSKIIASPDGRVAYDYQIGENSSGNLAIKDKAFSSGLGGAFSERAFLIPDEFVEDFLINDLEELAFRYLQNVAPKLEFYKAFGSLDAGKQISDIETSWTNIINNAPKEERIKLGREKNRNVKDLETQIQRLNGTFNISDPSNPVARITSAAKNWAYMRLMGGVVPSSVMDITRIFTAEGIVKTFSNGIVPLIKNLKTYKIAAEDARAYIQGTNAVIGRAEVLADINYMTQPITKFEQFLQSGAKKFSSINLMNSWTRFIKGLHGVVAQTRIADELISGVYDPRLKQLGISESDAPAIAKQIELKGYKKDGVWVINVSEWDRSDLALKWMGALRKESDRVIIMPGQEKPAYMSKDVGSTLLQFQSFNQSATIRMTASMLQRQDKHIIEGMMTMLPIGFLIYAFKEWNAGRELSDDPKVWVAESIDRTGMLGVLGTADNMLTKLSRDSHGLRPWLGISGHSSKFAGRTMLETAAGPTFGTALDSLTILSEFATSQENGGRSFDDKDIRAGRRLVFGNNLFYFRRGIDEIEKSIADAVQ